MSHRRWINYLALSTMFLWVSAQAQDDRGTGDAGIGFALSSNGQSLFYTRGTNPFRTNQRYFSVGFHQEENGLSVPYYDPLTGTFRNNSTQSFYLESGGGWRRLWLQDKLAAGFFPHTILEVGMSGFMAEFGTWDKKFRELSFRWSPYWQAGFGASIHTQTAVYRIEFGYLTTVPLFNNQSFQRYEGAFIKVVVASGQKPR